jgi:hypothetical protein
MPGFMRPCRYCGKLVPPDSGACPYCGKVRPLESPRCPRCRSPIEAGWQKCAACGASLRIKCPGCGKETFFGDYCEACSAPLTTVCPNKKCKTEQPPGEKCIKCGKPLK